LLRSVEVDSTSKGPTPFNPRLILKTQGKAPWQSALAARRRTLPQFARQPHAALALIALSRSFDIVFSMLPGQRAKM
jgi:hypothetical protein